jgi:hypothetical protein
MIALYWGNIRIAASKETSEQDRHLRDAKRAAGATTPQHDLLQA